MSDRLFGIVLFTALSACAHGGLGGNDSAPMSDRGWREFETEHFTLHSNQSDYMAGLLLDELERDLRLLQAVAFADVPLPAERLTVLLLEPDLLQSLTNDKQVGGQFRPSDDTTESPHWLLLELPPGGVLGELEPLRQTVLHELTHGFVRRAAPRAPAWLNEGMAGYWQSLDPNSDGDVIVGRPPNVGLLVNECASLTDLIGQDASHFYERSDRRPVYAAAWAAVHTLYERYPDRLKAYIAALRQGRDEADAWKELIGLSAADLDQQIRQRFTTDDGIARRIEGPHLPAFLPSQITAESPAATHVLWARVADTKDAQSPGRVEAELLAAERLDPQLYELKIRRAYLLQRTGQLVAARDRFAELRQIYPTKSALLYAWASTSLAVEMKRPAAERDLASLDERFTQLAASQRSASSLELGARFLLERQGPDAAKPLAEASVQRNPECVHCLETLALVRQELGDEAGVVDALVRAVAAWPYEEAPTRLLAELAAAKENQQKGTGRNKNFEMSG